MDRNKVREMLPQGSLKEVANLANVSNSAVTNYFKGRSNSYKIEMASLKVAQRYEKERRTLISKIESI